jgi:integrase/recombinase XerD
MEVYPCLDQQNRPWPETLLTYLENVERSPNTVRAYAHHLKLFWEYLREAGLEWSGIGLSELSAFVSWLRDPTSGAISMQEHQATRSEPTINAILAAVFMLYDYQERIGAVKEISFYHSRKLPYRRYKDFLYHINQSKPVQTQMLKLKEREDLPETLSYEQVNELMGACHHLRDRLLVSLLYESGMRIGQALGLRHADIHSWDNVVHIIPRTDNVNGARSKTYDANVIHVPADLMALYSDYLVYEFEDTESDYVFVNLWDGQYGHPMTYAAVADLFRRLIRKTGVEVHPHMLRHTHATELKRAGWDTALIQKRLGHKHIQTTEMEYIHLEDKDMKLAYQAYCETRKR